MGNCISICEECKFKRFSLRSKKSGTKISDLPDEILESIFLCISIEMWYSSIRLACSRWNRLVNRLFKMINALCFDVDGVQISLFVNRKRPSFIKCWIKMSVSEEELLFLRPLYTHRIEPPFIPTVEWKKCETFSFCPYIATIPAPEFSPFCALIIPHDTKRKQRKWAAAFLRFLVNKAVNVKYLHFNFSPSTKMLTDNFYAQLLWTIAHKCENVESLHVNGTFFRAIPYANSIFCTMLPNLQHLIELVVLDDVLANEQLDMVSASMRDFVEMMVTSCPKIRRLELGHLKLSDETALEMLFVLKLQRLAFSASNSLLAANWTNSFSTMTELKFLIFMSPDHEQFIREGLQFIASMPNLRSMCLGFQSADAFCMHAGYVARVLSQGFVALKNLFLENFHYEQLTQRSFAPSARRKFLDNLAPKLEILSLKILDDFGPYTDCLSTRMKNLKILFLDGKYLNATFGLVSMIVKFCPLLSQLYFSNRTSCKFFKFVQRLHEHLHASCSEKCREISDGIKSSDTILKIATPVSLTTGKKEDVQAALNQRICGLRIYTTHDEYYVALIRRTKC